VVGSGDVLERVLVERSIERIERFLQHAAQPACRRDDTVIGPRIEALHQSDLRLGRANDGPEVDVGCRPAELDPAAASAGAGQQAVPGEMMYDLTQVALRYREGGGDLRDGRGDTRPRSQIHQHPQAVVGEARQSHRPRTLRRG